MTAHVSPFSGAGGPAPTPRRRIRSLDGLRGIASVVVVVHHCMEASSATLVDTEDGIGARPPVWSWTWWAAHSPLHLVLLGPEPVYVFFVLSGLVLTLPVLGRPKVDWGGFWVARLTRLYIPAWASLVVAAAVLALVPRTVLPGRSPWLNSNGIPPSLTTYGTDASLLSGGVNGPLWSLRYQVLFSLLMPVYLMFFARMRGRTALKIAVIGAASMFGAAGGSLHIAVYRTAEFMPMFAVGVMMAAERDRLTAWIARRSTGQAVTLILLSIATLSADSWTLPHVFPPFQMLSVLGAALLVLLFLGRPRFMSVAEGAFVQWAGKRSFSLYIIHAPIVAAVADLLVYPSFGMLCLLAVPLSFLLAEVFYRLVERPSRKLGHRLGRSWRTMGRAGVVLAASDVRQVGHAQAERPSTTESADSSELR